MKEGRKEGTDRLVAPSTVLRVRAMRIGRRRRKIDSLVFTVAVVVVVAVVAVAVVVAGGGGAVVAVAAAVAAAVSATASASVATDPPTAHIRRTESIGEIDCAALILSIDDEEEAFLWRHSMETFSMQIGTPTYSKYVITSRSMENAVTGRFYAKLKYPTSNKNID